MSAAKRARTMTGIQIPKLFDEDTVDADAAAAAATLDEVKRQRKVARRRVKLAQRDERSTQLTASATAARIIVGIDPSYVSPAMCIVDRTHTPTHCTIVCFADSQAQVRVDNTKSQTLDDGRLISIRVLTYPKFTCATERYANVTQLLLDQLQSPVKETLVGIEDYAYSRMKDDASSKLVQLAEMGGVLRHELLRRGYRHHNIAISAWRAHFSPGGRDAVTKKRLTWRALESATRGVSWRTCIVSRAWASHDNGNRAPPKPADDIADAYGIADYLCNGLE